MVAPNEICSSWVKPSNWGSRERHGFPMKKKDLPLLDGDFMKYLKKLKNGTLSANVLGARRFLALLSLDGKGSLSDYSLLELMLGCYKHGAMDEILNNTELCSAERTWSRPMTTALNHMLHHLKILCGRQKLIEEKNDIDQMAIETLKAHTRQETKAKKTERRAKKRKDAATLKCIAPIKKIKKAVKKAMKKLQA